MNERIEKLAEQAGIWKPTHDHKTWVRGEYISSPGELEKFAELIVRECADLLEVEYGQSALTGNAAAKSVKQHFGVK